VTEPTKQPYRPTVPLDPSSPSVHEHATQPYLTQRTSLPPAEPIPLPTLPGYRVLEEIGRGSMGIVYRAWHERLDLEVALKIPHGFLVTDPVQLERFFREAQAAARLIHPNLCRVLDVGLVGDLPYLAMTYVPGRSLAQQPPRDAVAIAQLIHTLAVALAEAHRHGVIHRDLKPSNILIQPDGEPVVTDFGLALRLDGVNERLTQMGSVMGTPHYMAPEQARGDVQAMGPACDVYSLGVVLYELLTGQLPFQGPGLVALLFQVVYQEPARPSQVRPEVDPRLEAICLKAMAKTIEQRYPSMLHLADALAEYLHEASPAPAHGEGMSSSTHEERSVRPLVPREVVRFAFAGLGERAPSLLLPADRLYLDVGNELRVGVIDRHHRWAAHESTTALVLAHPELINGCVIPTRRSDAPFVLVLHERPDLDGIAAAHLALSYLATGRYPLGARELAEYVDQANQGAIGISEANPYSLYTAFQQLGQKLLHFSWNTNHERWQEYVQRGLALIAFALTEMNERQGPLEMLDAFSCPGQLTEEDRQEIQRDRERYRRKLADPRCQARRARLRLPGKAAGTVEVEALLVRDVQGPDDPERCAFFRDWARVDSTNCPDGRGFVALAVFFPECSRQVRRCILSLKPDSGSTFAGLGAILEQAEAERRRQIFGVDDRIIDPTSGQPRPPRPGYDNADPWYDGRAHGSTYIDSPRSGTLLRAEEIEALLLRFGQGEETVQPIVG
jgi:serine/threonine protein kinase